VAQVPPLRITGFAGIVPRAGRRYLQNNQAQIAYNCKLTSGDLVALRAPLEVNVPTGVSSTIASIYRLVAGANAAWLSWPRDVDVVRSLVASDTTGRIYYTGDGEPRVTSYALATAGTPYPYSAYVLGVYPPAVAPSASPSGGAGTDVTRVYVYTYVAKWADGAEEESAPSPVSSSQTGKVDGTWTITINGVAPANTFTVTNSSWATSVATLTVSSTFGLRVGEEIAVTGMTPTGYNTAKAAITALTSTTVSYAVTSNPGAFSAGGTITRIASHNTGSMVKRLYESVTTSGSSTDYFLVSVNTHGTEIPVGTTSVVRDNAVTPSSPLPSLLWSMPPTDLECLRAFPGGVLVGISGNQVLLSVPYRPYAWPSNQRYTIATEPVAVGVFGSSVAVATSGAPEVLTGIDPAAMSQATIPQLWPCLAKRGLAQVANGVVWPTYVGLAFVGANGHDILTRALFTQEEFEAVEPSSFIASVYDNRYYAGFANSQMLVIDNAEAANLLYVNYPITAAWTDDRTGKFYVVRDNAILEWEGADGERLMYDWLSKEFLLAPPVNFGAAKVDADFSSTTEEDDAAQDAYDAVVTANAAIITSLAGAVPTLKAGIRTDVIGARPVRGSALEEVPPLTWDQLTFQLYAGGVLRLSKTITDSKPFKLPAGYKQDTVWVRLLGNVRVNSVAVAGNISALMNV
jgi:hypothetical protein